MATDSTTLPTPTPPPAPPVSDLGAGGNPTVAPPTVSPAAPVSTNAETPATGFGQNLSQTTVGTPHPIDQAISELKDLYNNPLESVKKTGKSTVMMPVELAYQLVHHPVDTVTGITGGPEFAEALKRGDIPGMAGAVAGGLVNVGMGEKGLEAAPEVGAHLAETGKNFAKGVAEEGKAALEAKAPEGSSEAGRVSLAKVGGKKISPIVKPKPGGQLRGVGGIEVRAPEKPAAPTVDTDGWITKDGFKEIPYGLSHKDMAPDRDTQAAINNGDVRVATLGTSGNLLHFEAGDIKNPDTRAKIADAIRNSNATEISMEFTQPGAYKHVTDLEPEKAISFLEANGGTTGTTPAKPAETVAAAAPIHPALDAVRQKFGVGDVSDKMKTEPSFIGPDGKVSTIGANTHAGALGSVPEGAQYGNDESGRTNFINDAKTIRVAPQMNHQAGETFTFTVPKDGVTPEQVDALKQSAGLLKNRGNIIIETADKPAASKSNLDRPDDWQYKGVRDVEPILDKLGVHPNQTVKMNDHYGETGKYLGGAGDTLHTNEYQSELKQPYSIAITDKGGAEHFEPIDAFSSKDALKVAQKKFPDATDWSIDKTGKREPAAGYSVPTNKLLSLPESGSNRTPVQTMRHELGHAMVGANEGLTQRGMLRHTHMDAHGRMRAAVRWDASDVMQPGTRLIKTEKLPGMIKTFMGGIAADEAFNDIPRSANRNFDFDKSHSDGGQAYRFLKDAGFSHEESVEYMHKMIDSAKEYLTQPHVADIIKENENVREPGLSRQYHYSSERLQQMHEEALRRGQNGNPDNAAVNGGGVENRAADDARGEGKAAGANKEVGWNDILPEKITTAEVKSDKDEDATSFNFGANAPEKPAAKPWAKIVAAHNEAGGSTFNLAQNKNMAGTDNFAVSTHPDRTVEVKGKLTPKAVQDFAAKNADLLKDPTESLGTWLRPKDGVHVLDVVKTIPDRAEAVQLGHDHAQDAIFDMKQGKEIFMKDEPQKTPNGNISESQQAATPESSRTGTQLGNRISSRFPTATNATEDPMGHDLTLDASMIHQRPAIAQRLADKLLAQNKSMKFTPEELKTPKGILDSFVRHAKDNIKAMYEHVTPENRIQDREWYDGAHEIGNKDAKASGLEPRQNWAAIASQSPQKDWNQNVSLYERLTDTVLNKSDVKFTPEMQTKATDFIRDIAEANQKKIAKGKKPTTPWVDTNLIQNLKGKSLSDLSDPVEKAAFVRIYDEAHNPREFHELAPDGSKKGIMMLAGTNTPEKVAWGGLNSIAKGISVLQDGSLENISRNLGEAHKVRSFYNNIAEPESEHGDVTADTHHVGLSLMRPVAGDDPETGLNFGGNGSTITGVHGSYPLYVEATRQAMHEINAEHPNDPPMKYPRQLQSVVWVEWRKVFPPETRTAETKADVDNIWKEHLDGKITADEARKQVFDYAEKLRSRLDAGTRSSADEGKLPADKLSGAGNSRGSGGGPASRVVDKKLDAQAKTAAQSEAARVAKNKADLADFVARSAAKKAGMTKGISGLAKPKKK